MSDCFGKLGITPKNGKLTAEQIGKVKGYGCLRDKTSEDSFNVRVITRNGKITTDEQRAIADAADKYGSGEIAMTSRMTIEIQGVRYDDIPGLIMFLKDKGVETGGTGPKVRPVVSCKGTTCQFGLIDTFKLSREIHDRFYVGYHNTVLPHKFKIAVGGCPNNCVKPDLNDIGVIGQCIYNVNKDKCRGCKKCAVEASCPMKAATVIEGKISVDSTVCNNCGRCVSKCPFGAFEKISEGFRLCLGGRWGKKTAVGKPLSKLLKTEKEVLDAVEKAIILFHDEGVAGERFADTVARLGFEYVEGKIINE